MTADRDELAAALGRYWETGTPDWAVDDLLPVVERIAARKASEAEAAGYERGRRDFQFQPSGDNHHNAALCPYCSPVLAAAVATEGGAR